MRLQEAGAGLFFTSLVKTQTNVENENRRATLGVTQGTPSEEFERYAREQRFRLVPITSVEQRFRHSGWQLERLRVMHALSAASVPRSRFDRFCVCGGDAVAEWSPSRQRHRVRANFCGDRFCLPCARARAHRVRGRVEKLVGRATPLLIDLTILNKPQSLTDALNHLLRSFRRLRQQRVWIDAVKGGAAFVEIKRGKNSGQWHPHLHIIAIGSYIPAKELSDAWLKATGDSYRVRIERAHSPEGGAAYATKYATKGWTAEVVRDHDSLVECVLALRGRRLCQTFGDWHNADLEGDDSGPDDWRRVGRIDRIYSGFLAAEPWAVAAWRSIMGGVEEKLILPPAPE